MLPRNMTNLEKKTFLSHEKKKLLLEKFEPIRGEKFVLFIKNLLKRAKIPEKEILKYTGENEIKLFDQAFTHSSYNPKRNYEVFEFIGDSIINFCVVEYLTRRFKELITDDGNEVGKLARLKINLISKIVFSKCAEFYEFNDFIASDMYNRKNKMINLLEDTFEAFNGILHRIQTMHDLNGNRKGYLVGVGATYRLITEYFDTLEISTKYEDLYDSKSRLKELLDKHKKGYPKIHTEQKINDQGKIVFTTTINIPTINNSVWGTGIGMELSISEQNACENAFQNLKKYFIN